MWALMITIETSYGERRKATLFSWMFDESYLLILIDACKNVLCDDLAGLIRTCTYSFGNIAMTSLLV